jgi:hypothetical protein
MADTQGPDFAEIKAELLRRIDALVRELAPQGKKSGAYWMASDPTGRRADRNPSFWILINGSAVGAWKDEVTGECGDVIDLVTHCARLNSRKDTRRWCLDWLGWGAASDWGKGVNRERRAASKEREAARLNEERRAADELAHKRRKAKAWWLGAVPMIEGTAAETYLNSRGIDIARLASPPRALRFLEKAEHVDGDGCITEWPCMMAAMCDPSGSIIAVHRTFLAADGNGKAPVRPAKKIWPHGWQGAVIRLAKGATRLRPEEAVKRDRPSPLVITEGIEDGLSIALACPEFRVWAAGTLGNIAHVPVDHGCVSKVIVFADNDAGPEAKRQFEKALAQLRTKRSVTVARSFAGKDANDLLRGLTK